MQRQQWTYGSPFEWLSSPEPMVWRRAYIGEREQIAAARDFARALFAGTAREDDVASIVTELVSNALLHTRSGQPNGWFGLELEYADLSYIGVTDLGGGGTPTVQPAPPPQSLEENGRGLRIVQNLATSMGVHGHPDGGHTVWADVDLRARDNPTVPRPDLTVVPAS
ncbi:ATP-binding protein [Actinomadura barringtoniae]|uniref:ATP-binding protein n=1 Tax=Actinomadura barringtoniae TaxID=1427535 RepID=A0A939TCV2_9ACTN|nr:ATP-binding protein [Actinomadura barringtoniae]MBO2451645.1 ATP-binding protein [Actinomadura barringtoniae]